MFKFLIITLFFIGACVDQNANTRNDNRVRDREGIQKDNYRETSSSSRNSGTLRQVNTSSLKFRALKKSDFDGEDCEDDRDCPDLCRDMFSSSNRDRCEKYPINMVETLYETFQSLQGIRSSSGNGVDPSTVGFLFDLAPRLFQRKLRSEWGIRGVASFLSWVASSPSAAQAMNYRKNKDVMEEIFNEFANLSNADRDMATALSIGISRERDTFLYLVQDSNNTEGLQLALDLLGRDNAMLALCKRRTIEEEYSYYTKESSCYYLDVYEAEDEDYCYTQGPDVWSYVQRSVQRRDVSSRDVSDALISTSTCNTFCLSNGDCNL